MKRTISNFLAVMLLVFALSIPAVASVNDNSIVIGGGGETIDASHQIAGHSITITPLGGGQVRVVANVAGTHSQMTRIGFPTIVLYERINNNSSWSSVRTATAQWNPNATAGSHSHVITYQGVAGRQYRAEAQFFARDSLGSDTRDAISPFITAS